MNHHRQKTLYSDNVVLRTLLPALKDNTFVAIGSKYDIRSYNVSVKLAVWYVFAMSLEAVLKWQFFKYTILAYFRF